MRNVLSDEDESNYLANSYSVTNLDFEHVSSCILSPKALRWILSYYKFL